MQLRFLWLIFWVKECFPWSTCGSASVQAIQKAEIPPAVWQGMVIGTLSVLCMDYGPNKLLLCVCVWRWGWCRSQLSTPHRWSLVQRAHLSWKGGQGQSGGTDGAYFWIYSVFSLAPTPCGQMNWFISLIPETSVNRMCKYIETYVWSALVCMSGSSGLQNLLPASGQRRKSGRRSSGVGCFLSLLESTSSRAGPWAGTVAPCSQGRVTPAELGSLKLICLFGAWNRMGCCVGVGMNPGHGYICLLTSLGGAHHVLVSLYRAACLVLLIFCLQLVMLNSWRADVIRWISAAISWKCWEEPSQVFGSLWLSCWRFELDRAGDTKAIFSSLLLSFGW